MITIMVLVKCKGSDQAASESFNCHTICLMEVAQAIEPTVNSLNTLNGTEE